jgi:SPW repeat
MRRHREAILDVYKLALGVHLFASPWLLAFRDGAAAENAWAAGALIVGLSFASIFAFFDWEEWLTFLLGGWLVIAPWLLHFRHPSATHISVGVGIIVFYLAALELWLVHYAQNTTSPHSTDHGTTQT